MPEVARQVDRENCCSAQDFCRFITSIRWLPLACFYKSENERGYVPSYFWRMIFNYLFGPIFFAFSSI